MARKSQIGPAAPAAEQKEPIDPFVAEALRHRIPDSKPAPEPATHEEDPLLTPEEVGRRIGVAGRTVRRWCADGLMEHIRTPGGLWKIRTSDVNRFLAGSDLAVKKI